MGARPVVNVDELDFRILKEMFLGTSPSFRRDRVPINKIAEAVGANRKTVAVRIGRLTNAGLFLPPTLGVEPSRLGLVRAKVYLEGAEVLDDEGINALCHVEGLQTILGYADGFDAIIHAEDDPSLATRVEVARRLVKAKRVRWDIHSTRDFPRSPSYKLEALDVRLLSMMLANARRPFPRLASALGVTPRSLERRFRRLSTDGVVIMLPAGDGHSDFAGMIITSGIFDLADDPRIARAAKEELIQKLPNHFVRNLVPERRVHLLLYNRSLADVENQIRMVKGMAGVERVTIRTVSWIGASPRYQTWLASVLDRRAFPTAPRWRS